MNTIELSQPGETTESRAQSDYEEALRRLEDLEVSGCDDKVELQVIYQLLKEALIAERNNPQFRTGMAYYLFLLGLESSAKRHLNRALQLDPNYQNAIELRRAIEGLSYMPAVLEQQIEWEAFERIPVPNSDDKFDAYYDMTETFISEKVAFVMHQQIPSEPSLDQALNEDQERFFALLNESYRLIQEKLTVLDEEFDTGELLQKMHPLKAMWERYQRVVKHNTQLEMVVELCAQAMMQTRKIARELKREDSDTLDILLEEVIDICDLLADEIDSLEKTASVEPVLKSYALLCKEVEALQEQMDE